VGEGEHAHQPAAVVARVAHRALAAYVVVVVGRSATIIKVNNRRRRRQPSSGRKACRGQKMERA
jgi:hypothetical protein